MCISITNNNGSVQFIDDEAGVTLAGTSTAGNAEVRFNMSAAYELGKAGAEQAKGKGIEEVIVDRGGRKFHGRVREVVRGALDSGLKAGSSSLAAAGEPVQGDKEEQ
jgi:large subunit ribosomal protein L18